jgi:hypothetical protein
VTVITRGQEGSHLRTLRKRRHQIVAFCTHRRRKGSRESDPANPLAYRMIRSRDA